ncbi:hypothetical protein HMPREF9318_00118 [Streptococcus urinalis FB127-CNA-2]|uniref:ASCH domain protein n=1 Tax=Streptococcus urinalis 2285-97 TaxID=764291 RepID=G5KEM2_9STRE|nr:ASCH domain protein [Streptococcus urinalis 2285-97]EKS21920.1 hypothetical protein HMPREF9318_00118 [Streptococcus urinalis FB127-CNA-2]VEF31733.1 Domain of Uncharacterised Function with PDB structure [Streptococcus urinalis]VTS39648.1 Domain of Uncharacterised Function with PDB structure [Streptococcus porcinus]
MGEKQMRQHMLKCYPQYFEAVKSGIKNFECRYNDRDFKVGDELLLREYDPKQGYTDRCIVRKITYVLSDFTGLKDGYVILELAKRESSEIERERAFDILKRKNRVLSTKNTELEVDNLAKEFEIRLLKTAFGTIIKGIASKEVAVNLFDLSMQKFKFRLSEVSVDKASSDKVYIKQIKQDFEQIESELERRIRTEQ